jgi:DNA-directed RNA polymerase subunit RPC12/RpoP
MTKYLMCPDCGKLRCPECGKIFGIVDSILSEGDITTVMLCNDCRIKK